MFSMLQLVFHLGTSGPKMILSKSVLFFLGPVFHDWSHPMGPVILPWDQCPRFGTTGPNMGPVKKLGTTKTVKSRHFGNGSYAGW